MKFVDNRLPEVNQLKTGDILHCFRDTLLSRIIVRLTGGDVSHTAVVVECWDQVYVVDAQKDGVNARPLTEWLKKYKYSKITVARGINPMSKNVKKEYSIKAFSMIGHTGYDFVTLLLRFPIAIFTGKWLKERKLTDRMTCSHYVGWLENLRNAEALSPKDIKDYTMKLDGIEFNHYDFVNIYAYG